MLTETIREVKNAFAIDRVTGQLHGYESGKFTLADGKIQVKNKYVVGQYIAVTGSVLNDGVYKVESFADGVITIKESDANDKLWGETFTGTIYSLRVPQDFIQLVDKIKEFTDSKAGEASNIVSASFGVQNQSFGVNASGVRAGWVDVFRQDLHKFRRMTPDIII